MAHLMLRLPYAGRFEAHTDDSVSVFIGARSLRLNLVCGDIETTRAERAASTVHHGSVDHRLEWTNAVEIRGVRMALRETRDGPVTEFTKGAGGQTLVTGALRGSWNRAERMLALVELPDQRRELAALWVGEPVAHRLPAMAREGCAHPYDERRPALLAGEGDLAVGLVDDLLYVVRFDRADVRVVALTLPAAWGEPFVQAGKVRIVSGSTLLIIDTDLLAFDAPFQAAPIAFEELAYPPERDDQLATVSVALANVVMLEHPRLGQVRAVVDWNEAPLQKGERVWLHDVREELPGLYRVHVLSRVEAAAGADERSQEDRTLALPSSWPAPELARYGGRAAPRTQARELAALAERHGFRVPALLTRIIELDEDVPVFARWLRELDLPLHVGRPTRDWEGDPNVLTFLSRGDGDEYGLYVYPPACRAGEEPAIVLHCQDTREVEFCARSFDALFEQILVQREDDPACEELTVHHRQVVALVRERLSFPRRPRAVGEAPAWLLPRPPDKGLTGALRVVRGTWFESQASLLERERALLARFLQQGLDRNERAAALGELRGVCERLGFSLALENLGLLENHHPDGFLNRP